MPNGFALTFRPLCATPQGQFAINARQPPYPPFVDASIRREPDLEHPLHPVTGLCRPGFVKRLRTGDILLYLVNTQRLQGQYRPQQRGYLLVAALEVVTVLPSHPALAIYCQTSGFVPSGNCMVPGNPPLPLAHAGPVPPAFVGAGGAAAQLAAWDALYDHRAIAYPMAAITQLIGDPGMELFSPPCLPTNFLTPILGIGFQHRFLNPPPRPIYEIQQVLALAGWV